MSLTATARSPYVRNRYTWLAYFMLGYFAYVQAAPGPAMPFLRAELSLNYTVAGLYFSLMAVGMILAGLTGAGVVRRLGRPAVFWGGGAGMAAGAILLIVGRSAPVTIGGAFVMGLFGTYLLNIIPATLSDLHGPNRGTAVTEANVAASAATVLPPVLIGLFVGTAIGWRAAFWAAIAAWLIVAAASYRVALPRPAPSVAAGLKAPLPRRFWLIWVVILLATASEWSVTAWGADFMVSQVGLPRATASTLMSAFFLAMVTGRFVGSRLTRRADSLALLPGALALALAGYAVFWLAPAPVLNVAGLFLAGLGIANLFPLSLAVATTAAGDQTDRASARVSLGAGIAILIAPQVLGAAADAVGLAWAMGLVLLLLAGGGVMIAAARAARAGA